MIRVRLYKETSFDLKIGYASIIILILFSTSANEIFLGGPQNKPPYYYLIVILLYFLVYLIRYKHIPIIYFKIISILFLYDLVHLLMYHDIHTVFTLYYLFFITAAFFTIRLNGNNFFERLEKVIYYGAIISLLCFILQNIFFYQFYTSVSFLQHVLGITTKKYDGLYYSNIIFYTINTTIHHRNCGFMFEPGAYGAVLAVAIGLNLIHNKFKIKNRRLVILLIALITTQSTTAFLALFCLILFYIVNKGSKKTIILVPVIILIIYLLFQLPFMWNKLKVLSHNPEKQLTTKIDQSYNSQNQESLGRFASLILNLEDFKKSPIFGIAGHHSLSQINKMNWNVDTNNGIGTYLAALGLFGMFFLLFNLNKSFSCLGKDYKFKGHYFLILMILVDAFSFDLLRTPLFFSFQIYYLSKVKLIFVPILKNSMPFYTKFQKVKIESV